MMRASLPLYHLPLMTLLVVLMFSINPMIYVLDQLQEHMQVIGTIGEYMSSNSSWEIMYFSLTLAFIYLVMVSFIVSGKMVT
jgi:hypothetical protein